MDDGGGEDLDRPVSFREMQEIVQKQNAREAELNDRLHEMELENARLQGRLEGGGGSRGPEKVLPGDENGWKVARAFARELAKVQPDQYGSYYNEIETEYQNWREADQRVKHDRELEDVRLETELTNEGFQKGDPVVGLVRNALNGGASMKQALELIVKPHKAARLAAAQGKSKKETAEDQARRSAIESGADGPPRTRTTKVASLDQAATQAVIDSFQSGRGRSARSGSLARVLGYSPSRTARK